MTNPAFHLLGPEQPQRPVIVSVPHAGRHYPAPLLATARVPAVVLQRLEDRYADALVADLSNGGFTVSVALTARAWIDLNRAEDEWDGQIVRDALAPSTPNHRVRAGLGIVPVRLHPHGALWRSSLTYTELVERIETIHRPWHEKIESLLMAAYGRFGSALLLDIHSMPHQAGGGPQLVIGDRHGQTATPELVEHLLGLAEGAGLSVARNAPYAGAHGVDRHGRRGSGREALQIEVDRSLYLDANGFPLPVQVARIARLLRRMAEAAEDWLLGSVRLADAAE